MSTLAQDVRVASYLNDVDIDSIFIKGNIAMELDSTPPSPSGRLEAISTLKGHEERVWNIAWNPTKSLLASCSSDKSVRLFHYKADPSSNVPRFTNVAAIETGHAKTVRAVAWAPSGRTFATASFDSNIGIWEREPGDADIAEGEEPKGDWECVSLLEGHETECKSVGYSCTGTLLASCSRDKTVWIWEVHPDADFECISVNMSHTQDVKSIAWHPTDEILASASYDDTIKLFVDDPSDDWYDFQTLSGHESTVWALAFSPNGQYLASASDDRTIRIWCRTSQYQWDSATVIEGAHARSIYSVSWGLPPSDADEQHLGFLASAGGDGKINVWQFEKEADPLTPQHRLVASQESAHGVCDVNAIAWCPRRGFETLLASAGDDCITRIWRLEL